MVIIDQTSCPADSCEFEQRASRLRATVSKLLNLCAISFALAVAGCARDSGSRDIAASPPQVKTASAPSVPPARRHSERHYLQARIRKLDPALLAPQPAPNCEYKRSDLKTVDPEEWARLKTEYELQCYRETEKATRTRLGLLQSSIQHLQD
jgi:hypothetical protein